MAQTIFSLSDDSLVGVFSFLPLADLACCSTVCRLWNTVFQDENLWLRRIATEFSIAEAHAPLDPAGALATYKLLLEQSIRHRFSLRADDRNPEMMVSEDGLTATPDNGSWNLILSERDIVVGRLFRAALRIERSSSSLTFRIGLLAGTLRRDQFRSRLDDASLEFRFWGTNEYLMCHSPDVPSSKWSSSGQKWVPGDVMGFEMLADGTLSLFMNGYVVYTYPRPVDPLGMPLRIGVQLSGKDLSATFVPFVKEPDQENPTERIASVRKPGAKIFL
jgi:hypothetical protein